MEDDFNTSHENIPEGYDTGEIERNTAEVSRTPRPVAGMHDEYLSDTSSDDEEENEDLVQNDVKDGMPIVVFREAEELASKRERPGDATTAARIDARTSTLVPERSMLGG